MFKMFQYTHPKIVLFRIFVTGLGDFSFVFAHVDIYLVASIPFIDSDGEKLNKLVQKCPHLTVNCYLIAVFVWHFC